MKIFKIILLVLLAAVFLGTLGFLYNKSKEKPVVWETATPKVDNIVKKTVATGSIVPRQEIEIKPQISGIIQEIFVEPGDAVKEGDIIARVKIIPDMLTLNNAESRLNKAKISFENAQVEFERQKNLYDRGVIADAEFQSAEMTFKNTQEELNAAEDNLQIVREGVLKKAGQSSNTLVRSTINGMILDVPVKEGNSVIESNTFNDGTTIAFIADMGEMIFEGKVDETEVGKINVGMDLEMTIGAIEGEKFNAVLEYISPKGQEENGAVQFEIKASVDLKEGFFIRSGYSANADLVLEQKDSVLTVEEKLVTFEGDSAFVEVESGEQQFEKKYFVAGLSDGVKVEVVEGLSEDVKIKIPQVNQSQN